MAKIEEDARAVAAVAAAEYEAAQDQTKDRSTATQSVKVENDGKTVTVEGKAKGKKNGKNGKSNKKTAKVTEAKEEKKRMSPKKQALRGALVGVAVVLLALQAGKVRIHFSPLLFACFHFVLFPYTRNSSFCPPEC